MLKLVSLGNRGCCSCGCDCCCSSSRRPGVDVELSVTSVLSSFRVESPSTATTLLPSESVVDRLEAWSRDKSKMLVIIGSMLKLPDVVVALSKLGVATSSESRYSDEEYSYFGGSGEE